MVRRARGPRARRDPGQAEPLRRALDDLRAKIENPKTRKDIPTYVLIPAFAISELKTAFQIGFLISSRSW